MHKQSQHISNLADIQMTPSQQCKQAGLKSLKQVSEMTDTSIQTLINWHRDKPKLFDVVINGCVLIIKTK